MDEDKVSEIEDAPEAETPAKKRKRTQAKGRIAQGDDFWSRVDSWFKEKIELWGADFSGVDWKMFVKVMLFTCSYTFLIFLRYIEESLTLDNQRHNTSKKPESPMGFFSSANTSSMQARVPAHGLSGGPQLEPHAAHATFDFMAAFNPVRSST